MNIIKKCLSVFLTLILLLSVIHISVSAAGVFAGGSGDESDPYQISSAAQLNQIRNYPSAHFVLNNDIVFSDADFEEGGAFYNDGYGWEPIESFSGTLDGNGYAIENLYVYNLREDTAYSGLIGINTGTVSNLSMYECFILAYGTNNSYSGAIAGINRGTIAMCNSSNWIYAVYSATSYAGGIAGSNEGNIGLCLNESMVYSEGETIDSNYSSGGIAGYARSDSQTLYCFNYGYIYGNYAGGIIGYAQSGNISLCRNMGAINEETEDFSTIYSGGIAGYITDKSTISACVNTGIVTASSTENYVYAGGIAGRNDASYISDSYNTGTITAKATASNVKHSYAGGIVGYNNCSSYDEAYSKTIVAVYNTGVVSAESTSTYTTKAVGGIAGINTGVISSAYYLDNIQSGIGSNAVTVNGTKKLTTAQMMLSDSFKGFDMKNMWWLSGKSGYDYPQLTLLSHSPAASIEITKQPPNTVFVTGSTPDLSGGEMLVTYLNGESETLDTGKLVLMEYDQNTVGKQTAAAIYGNYAFEIEITFVNKTPDEIKLTSLPDKLVYVQGQPLDMTGAILTAVYDDYTMELDIEEAEILYDTDATGEVEVSVSHSGLSTSFTVNVTERKVSSIEMESLPKTVVYQKGSELILDGAVLKTLFESEDSYFELIEITNEMLSGYNMNSLGKQSITVTHGGKTTSFDIYIVEGTLGDVNGDGKTDTIDLAALKLYLAGVTGTVVVETPGNADCNCDGTINTVDLAWLKMHLANS